jgi:uncharacterized protein (DUF58 family)
MFGFQRRAKANALSPPSLKSAVGSTFSAGASRQPNALLQTLSWPVIRRLDGIFQGDHETLFHGTGMRMSDIREYQAGDDVRHLDWNVSARTGTLHVRTFHEERELTAWFLIDTSNSLSFQSVGPSKQQMVEQVVGALAGLLVRHGDRLAAMLDSGSSSSPLRLLPPGSAQSHVVRLLEMMQLQTNNPDIGTKRSGGTPSGSKEDSSSTRLTPMLERALAVIRRRSLVILVSDFWVAPGWEQALRRLAQRHDVLCIQVIDPLEMQLPDVGMITVQDSESGEQVLVDTGDPVIRSRYETIMRQRQADIKDACTLSGADFLQLSADQLLLRQLMNYLAFRKKRKRLSGARASR